MSVVSAAEQIVDLFRKRPVLQMSEIERAVGPRSQRSLFRDLTSVGYLSSYTHTGRYYTLQSIPQFDTDGLWLFEGAGFSRDGTLKATVRRLVETSETGRTQRDLQLRLGVRVYNPLLDLVEGKQLRRDSVEDEYVYLAAARARATEQLEQRRALPTARTAPTLDVEVLLDVIHGARLPSPQAPAVAARLAARGIVASVAEVAAVIERYGLKKKPPSRSRRSRR